MYTIPNSEKKKYFQRIASPVSRGWNESNLIGWSRRHRANCKRFLQARRGRKNKASAIEWPVIFKWTVATHPRVWNSVWLSRNIYTSPPIVFTLLPSATKSKPRAFRAFARRKFQIVFPPLSFSFLFLFFFSHFYFYFLFFFFLHIPSQYLPWRFASRSSSREELKQQRLPFNAQLQPLRLWIHPGSILTLLVQKPIYLDPRRIRGNGFEQMKGVEGWEIRSYYLWLINPKRSLFDDPSLFRGK